MDLEKFGNFIKELRKEKGLNQEQLADELLVHRTTIVKWEQGKSLPLNDTLVLLSKYFNVTVDELLAGGRLNVNSTIEEKNKVTLSLLKSRRKSILLAKYFGIISVILVIIFLIYYFFTTYNSIHVYMLFGEGKNYKTRDGMLIINNENIYLKLGNFYNKEDELIEIKNISLYLDDEYETIILFSGDPKQLLFEKRNNIENFNIKTLKEEYNNIYLVINYNNQEEIIKLKAVKDFENKSLLQLFYRNTINNYQENNFEIKLSDKFIYDENTETYKLKDGNVEIECSEDIVCRIFVKNGQIEKYYEYDKYTNSLDYRINKNGRKSYKEHIFLNNIISIKSIKIYKEFKESILDKYLS